MPRHARQRVYELILRRQPFAAYDEAADWWQRLDRPAPFGPGIVTPAALLARIPADEVAEAACGAA